MPEILAEWSLPGGYAVSLPLFLTLGSLAALLVSMAKAGFGGSVGLLSVPMLIYACGGETDLALGIMLPVLIVCDYVSVVKWWRRWQWRSVWLLVPGTVVGIAAGWLAILAFKRYEAAGNQGFTDAVLKLGVGVIAVGFVGLQVFRSLRRRPLPFRPVLWQGTCFGAAAGLTSTLAHAAGPITTMYMLPQGLPKDRFVASLTLFTLIGNHLKLAPYIGLNLMNPASLLAAAALVPAVVGGALLGVYLNKRIDARHFTGIVYTLLLGAGAHLIYNGAKALWF